MNSYAASTLPRIPVAAPAFPTTDFLTPHEHSVRRPLLEWASAIQARLLGCTTTRCSYEDACYLVVNANEAALVMTHYGRHDAAELICNRAMTWLTKGLAKDDFSVARLALLPLLNLLRLDRIHHQWGPCFEKLSRLERYLEEGVICVPGVLNHLDAWPNVPLAHDGWTHSLKLAHTLESYRIHLGVGSFDRIVSLAQADHLPHAPWPNLMIEALIIANLQLKRYEDAALLADHSLRDCPKSAQRPVLCFRRAECAFLLHEDELLAKLIRVLSESFHRAAGTLGYCSLALLSHFIPLVSTVNRDAALDLSTVGLIDSRRLRDVRFETTFLGFIQAWGAKDVSAEAYIASQELRRTSLYGASTDTQFGARNGIDELLEVVLAKLA